MLGNREYDRDYSKLDFDYRRLGRGHVHWCDGGDDHRWRRLNHGIRDRSLVDSACYGTSEGDEYYAGGSGWSGRHGDGGSVTVYNKLRQNSLKPFWEYT